MSEGRERAKGFGWMWSRCVSRRKLWMKVVPFLNKPQKTKTKTKKSQRSSPEKRKNKIEMTILQHDGRTDGYREILIIGLCNQIEVRTADLAAANSGCCCCCLLVSLFTRALPLEAWGFGCHRTGLLLSKPYLAFSSWWMTSKRRRLRSICVFLQAGRRCFICIPQWMVKMGLRTWKLQPDNAIS